MGATSSAPRAVGRPAGRQDHRSTYTDERSTSRGRARLILALDGRSWAVADDPEAEAELRELADRLAVALVASVGKRTDTARLDWFEQALRDGLGAEARRGQILIGYPGAGGDVDASALEGSGPGLRDAIDDALDREDAAFAALDAPAEVAS